ncbi:MAG: hypothetical protein M3N19_00245 [Candidatus Eremiobacteraeota bacterium]|nr:hypothetical protein [Candidatus Eremiobacteraeota bacterium]
MKFILGIMVLAAVVPLSEVQASATVAPPASVHVSMVEKTSARRFKRGVRRSAHKVKHFFHRAAGKH